MRKLLILIVVLLVVLVGGLIALPFLVDVNQYKAQISQLIEKKTQRQVRLEGDIALQLFPPLGLEVNNVSLLQRNGEDKLVQIERLVLKLSLLPLLQQEIKVNSLHVDRLNLWLEVDPQGNNSWDVGAAQGVVGMQLADAETVTTDAPLSDAEGATLDQTLKTLELDEIIITDAEIFYRNALSQQHVVLNQMNVTADYQRGKSNMRIVADIAGLAEAHRQFVFDGVVFLKSSQSFSVEDAKLELGEIRAKLNLAANIAAVPKQIEMGVYLGETNVTPYVEWATQGMASRELPQEQTSFGDFLVASAQAQPSSSTKASSFKWSDDVIDLTALRDINGHIGLYFDGLSYQQYRLGKGDVYTRFQNGDIAVKIKQLNLLDGNVAGDVMLDVPTSAGISLKSDVSLSGVSLEALPATLKQTLYDPTGNIDLRLALRANGKSQKQMISTLGGTIGLNAKEMQFQTLADTLQAKINNPLFNVAVQPYRESFGDISQLSANWKVAKGVMRNDDFSLQASPVSFIGKGEVNLPSQQIYYRFEPLKTKTGEHANLSGVQLPDILLKGSLTAPEVKMDAGETVRGLIKKSLEKDGLKSLERGFRENRDNILNDFKKHFKEDGGLKNLLQGL